MLEIWQEKIQKGKIQSSSSADLFNVIVSFEEEMENFHVFQCRQLEAEQGRLQGHMVRGKHLCGRQMIAFIHCFTVGTFVLGNKHI